MARFEVNTTVFLKQMFYKVFVVYFLFIKISELKFLVKVNFY